MLSMGVMQERVATPSTWTVQAPHSAMPQPNFVPVMPSTSRNTQSSGVSPSTSTPCVWPLTLMRRPLRSVLFCQSATAGSSAERGKLRSTRRHEIPDRVCKCRWGFLRQVVPDAARDGTTKTNMAPLRGWAPVGQRIKAKVPNGHWKTMTFLAALRHDRVDAPPLIDGPINGERFPSLRRGHSRPDPETGRCCRHGQPRLSIRERPCAEPSGQQAPGFSSCRNTRPTSIRLNSSLPNSSTGSDKPQSGASKPSATPLAKFSAASPPPSAQTIS